MDCKVECGNCKYYSKIYKSSGTCNRFPLGMYKLSKEWCGEFSLSAEAILSEKDPEDKE